MIEIFLPMEKIPTATLQQKRAAYVKGRLMMYEPQNVKEAKSYYEHLLRPYRPSQPITNPVCIYIRWAFPIKDKKKWNTWKTSKPDVDNLEKILIDRFVKTRFIEDDSLVVSLLGEKVYVEPGRGGIHIQITEVTKEAYNL